MRLLDELEEEVARIEQLADKPAPTEVKLVNPVILRFEQGINYKGDYSASTTYEVGDGVTYQGSYYVAAMQTDAPPSDTANWQLVVERGEQGAKGDAGEDSTVPGPQGDVGRAATVKIGSVEVAEPGATPEVTNRGDDTSAVLDFVIPMGKDGRNPMTVSNTPPANPKRGDLWYQP